ncbi:membrane protein [Amycolatopsis taiwanensis]|uniref:Membrane protein n=1 Tax=Amycolatopsis taiwanensis TaxID=342230 RepID=A0A9W6QYU9_9PSEU|nr:membrane protein [Amycolatopsis taiwanensis]
MPIPGPETRIVELRVPGSGGTGGESLLDAVSTVEVAGDGIGRVVRPSDRLRRPAPGPVLRALGRPVPRTLEGYLWSGMTSGGAAKASWALLFPFSLANVAHWMLPPVPEGSRAATALGGICRGLLRVAGLLLTMLLVSQLAVVALDEFAMQCLAPASGCLTAVPDRLREITPLRMAAGLLPLGVVIFVLHRLSGTDWRVTTNDVTPRGVALPGDALRRTRSSALHGLHTLAALASVALVALGGPTHPPRLLPELVAWVFALALVLAAVVLAGSGVWGLRTSARRIVIAFAALVMVATAGFEPPGPRGSGIADTTVETIGAALLGVCVLFALLLVPAALLARRTWRTLPNRLRPWLGGWAAAPVLALAVLLGAGFGAGLAIGARRALGAEGLRLPAGYTAITTVWGAGLVLAGVVALLAFAIGVPVRRRKRGVPDVVPLLQDNPGDERLAARAWARSAWERRHLHHLALAVVLGMSACAAALPAARFGFHRLPGWLDQLSGVGLFALGAMAAGLLRVVYTAARKPGRNRHLGALADLVCFWPRAAHPTVPPCYALKAVPELTARAKHHLAEPNTRVVLGGHDQGSLLALVATARLLHSPDVDRERVGLLTAGSPLQWGYQRAFPAVLSHQSLTSLYGALEGRWRGLARGTDIFGGGVTTWRQQVVDGKLIGDGYRVNGTTGPLPPARPQPTGALVLGGDHWLPDPIRDTPGLRRWPAGILGHTGYEVDPEWDRAVAMAAGLERPDSPSRALGEQVPLFPDLPRFNINLAR